MVRIHAQDVQTMLPGSVDPRAHANRMSLHPPLENSFAIIPVWRISTGAALARLMKAAKPTRVALVYMVRMWVLVSGVLGVKLKAKEAKACLAALRCRESEGRERHNQVLPDLRSASSPSYTC